MFVASRVGDWEVSYPRDQDPLSRSRAMGVVVSGEYFETLGLNPQIGRLLGPEDDQVPGGHPVVVISDDLWRRHFQRDPGAVGETLRLNDTLFTIIGVAPRGFFGVAVGSKPDFWASIQMDRTLRAPPLRVFARLEPGVSAAQVQASLAPAFRQEMQRRAERAPNEEFRRRLQNEQLTVLPGGQGAESLRQQFSKPLLVLLGIVVLVLLIACANVANLLLTRSIERSREIALRASLGAGRSRLVRQLLTESFLLASIGGVAGLALAYPAARLLVGLAANETWQLGTGVDPAAIDVSPDLRVLLFTLAASTLAGVFFGLAPALGATRVDLSSCLKKQARSIGAGFWGLRWGRVLVVGQTALSVVLLVAAALFVQTLANLYSLDAGYDRHNVVVAKIDMNGMGLDFQPQPRQTRSPEAEAKIQSFYRTMLDGLRSVPGVESASISITAVANSIRVMSFGLKAAGYTLVEGEDQLIHLDAVGPGYFRTVGMDLLLGRDFSDRDSGDAPAVVILNDVAAKKYFGAENPIGRQVWFKEDEPMEVIGVVRSARYIDLREDLFPLMYQPALRGAAFVNFALVRTQGAPEAVAPAIRRQLATVAPQLRVPTITTLQRNVEDRTVNERLVAQLSAAFGALALVLADRIVWHARVRGFTPHARVWNPRRIRSPLDRPRRDDPERSAPSGSRWRSGRNGCRVGGGPLRREPAIRFGGR
jgi:predicted permease